MSVQEVDVSDDHGDNDEFYSRRPSSSSASASSSSSSSGERVKRRRSSPPSPPPAIERSEKQTSLAELKKMKAEELRMLVVSRESKIVSLETQLKSRAQHQRCDIIVQSKDLQIASLEKELKQLHARNAVELEEVRRDHKKHLDTLQLTNDQLMSLVKKQVNHNSTFTDQAAGAMAQVLERSQQHVSLALSSPPPPTPPAAAAHLPLQHTSSSYSFSSASAASSSLSAAPQKEQRKASTTSLVTRKLLNENQIATLKKLRESLKQFGFNLEEKSDRRKILEILKSKNYTEIQFHAAYYECLELQKQVEKFFVEKESKEVDCKNMFELLDEIVFLFQNAIKNKMDSAKQQSIKTEQQQPPRLLPPPPPASISTS